MLDPPLGPPSTLGEFFGCTHMWGFSCAQIENIFFLNKRMGKSEKREGYKKI